MQEVDFKSPKTGSKYAIIINEGCTAGLFGINKRPNFTGEDSDIKNLAWEYGYEQSIKYCKGII